MHSFSKFQRTNGDHTSETILDIHWTDFLSRFGLDAGLLVEYEDEQTAPKAILGHRIPKEPFNGSDQSALIELLQECFTKYPTPHIHSTAGLRIGNVLPRLVKQIVLGQKVIFFPVLAYNSAYVFLGWPPTTSRTTAVPGNLGEQLDLFLALLRVVDSERECKRRLDVAHRFVKEIGHDISSCVQAILAKIKTIRDGRVQGEEPMTRKLLEIEQEVQSTYGIADLLGLTMDQDYRPRSFTRFQVLSVVQSAQLQLSAEAQERNIAIDIPFISPNLELWGDELAIKQCLAQLLMNAIKYAFGGTFIRIGASQDDGTIVIRVSNRGHPLPDDDSRKRIYDFGVRGKRAKELHVNGSGVGLFTVRRIAAAHRGLVWDEENGDLITFAVRLPMEEKLRHELGM